MANKERTDIRDRKSANNFPYITDGAIMVYTLKKWYTYSFWSNDLMSYVYQAEQDANKVWKRVNERLVSVRELGNRTMTQFAREYGIKIAKNEGPADVVKKVMQQYNEQLTRARQAVTKQLNDNKSNGVSVEDYLTQLKSRKMAKTNFAVENSKTRTGITQALQTCIENTTVAENNIWEYLAKECIPELGTKFIEEQFMKSLKETLSTQKDSKVGIAVSNVKNLEEDLGKLAANDPKYNTRKDTIIKNYSKNIKVILNSTMQDVKKEFCKTLMQEMETAINLLANTDLSIADFQEQFFRSKLTDSDQTWAVRVGFLYEAVSALNILNTKSFNNSTGKITFTGQGENKNDITNDLEVMFEEGKKAIGISVKSAIDQLGSHKKDILLKNGKEDDSYYKTFIQDMLDNMLKVDPDMWRYLIANTFSINARGEEITQAFDIIGNVRHTLMEVAAMRYILGRMFTDLKINASNGSIEDMYQNISGYTFPLIVQMPQGAMYSIDVIDNYIEQMTKLKIGGRGNKNKTSSLVGETSGNRMEDEWLMSEVKTLQGYNYTYSRLRAWAQDPTQDGIAQTTYIMNNQIYDLSYPYKPEFLTNALKCMENIYHYLNENKMSQILRSNMSIWTSNIDKILQNYN